MKQMKRNSRLEMKREEKERREGGKEGKKERKGKRKGREKIIKTLSKQKGRSGHEIITYLTTSYYKISYRNNKNSMPNCTKALISNIPLLNTTSLLL